MILDVIGIQKILPHRYPFLMVDAILEMERLKRIVGVKNVSINESYFQGHFPGQPIMPGVLIIESMAQTGGLLLLQEVPDREKKLLYFVAVDGARFRRPVVPGDQLRVEMKVLSWRGDFCKGWLGVFLLSVFRRAGWRGRGRAHRPRDGGHRCKGQLVLRRRRNTKDAKLTRCRDLRRNNNVLWCGRRCR